VSRIPIAMAESFRKDVDYYEVLQVHPRAHPLVIRKVYHVLMRDLKHHPDLGGDVEIAQLINEAYSVLSDPVRREAYDRFRAEQGIRTEAPGQAQTVSWSTGRSAVFDALVADLEEALRALSAWPVPRTAPPFCQGRVASLETSAFLRASGFHFTGSVPTDRFGQHLEVRTYGHPQEELRLVVLSVDGVILAGMLSGLPASLLREDVVAGFVGEVSGGTVEPSRVFQLVQAVEYLDRGERRRRTKALDLWLVAATRTPDRAYVVLTAYPL
jgi:hypothetical protein